MRRITCVAAVLWCVTATAYGQTVINGGRSVLKGWDASAAAWTKPAKSGTAIPATCGTGEQFFKTDAPAGQNLFFCTAPDTWTQQAGGSAQCSNCIVTGSAAGGDLSGSYPNPGIPKLQSITDDGAVLAITGRTLRAGVTSVDPTYGALGTDIATPANPTAGKTRYYTKGGRLCSLNPSGAEYCLGTADMLASTYAGAGSGAPANPCATAGASYRDTSASPVAFYDCPSAGANWVQRLVAATAGTGTWEMQPGTVDSATAPDAGHYALMFDSGNSNRLTVIDQAKTITGVLPTLNASRRVCTFDIGANNGSALADADLGPQTPECYIPYPATVTEVMVRADGGTPNVIVGRDHAGTVANLTSSALPAAASGGLACSNATGTAGLDGTTTCSNTLQNYTLAAGDWLKLVSGSASTAKHIVVTVTYTVQ